MLRVVSGFLGRLGVLGDIIAILGYGVLVIGYLMNLWKLFGAVGHAFATNDGTVGLVLRAIGVFHLFLGGVFGWF